MFDRKKYKLYAKKMLKGRWTIPVLTSLITTIVCGIFLIPIIIQISQTNEGLDLLSGNYYSVEEFIALFEKATESAGSTLINLIQSIVQEIFIMASIAVILKITRSPDKVSFSSFIEGFNNWYKAALEFLWQFLWISLWSLLFFIPGIIKSIQYSQMRYILNEFENVSVTKSMRISIIITKGHLWDIFIMNLSFIGWDMLSLLTLGILSLWITPYKYTTYMNAFHAMLKESLETGRLHPEDLQ